MSLDLLISVYRTQLILFGFMKNAIHSKAKLKIFKYICWLGYVLASLGFLGVLLGILNIFDMQIFAIGLSSGIRTIGSVGISGCLLSAIGHASLEQHLI